MIDSSLTEEIIAPETAIEGFRLSGQQHRLWLLQQGGNDRPYRAMCRVSITGNLDKGRLVSAMEGICARHEILRTTFPSLPGMNLPVQVVSERILLNLTTHDFSGLSPAERDEAVDAVFAELRNRPFDYVKGPLIFASLITLEPRAATLIVCLSALCGDYTTLNNLLRELCRSYTPDLDAESEQPIQYVDLSEWQHGLLEAEDAQAGREYWHGKHVSESAAPPLYFEKPSQPGGEFAPRCVSAVLPSISSARLRDISADTGSAPPAFVQACWWAFLWRLSGGEEIVLGVAFDGRPYQEMEDASGLFSRYLPVRSPLMREMPLASLAASLHRERDEMSGWQPYYQWDHAAPAGPPPFWPLCFDFIPSAPRMAADGLAFVVDRLDVCTDRFKLKLACFQREDTLLIDLYYDNSLFAREDIQTVCEQFQVFLRSALDNPAAKIGSLDILTAAQRNQLLHEWNATGAAYPEDTGVHQLFEEQARRTPDADAVVFGDSRLSYRELDARSNQLAHRLKALGVGPDVLVGLCLTRSPEMVIGLLGILKAGGAYVPMDPSYPAERIGFMMRDSRAQVLVTEARLRDTLGLAGLHSTPLNPPFRKGGGQEGLRGGSFLLPLLSEGGGWGEVGQVLCLDSDWPSISHEPTTALSTAISAQNLAYMIYTSGSTGTPKGTMISHGGLVNYVTWSARTYDVQHGTGSLVHSSLGFDLTVTSVLVPLMAGQRVCLLPEEEPLEALGNALRNGRDLSLIKITPAHLEMLRHQLPEADLAGKVNTIVIGGEALLAPSVAPWRRFAPNTRLINEYGPTETVVGSAYYEVTPASPESGAVPIGAPIANTQLYILDEDMDLAPIGVAGELYIGGAGLSRGYLNQAALTATQFIPNPFANSPGKRLYRTGDLARYLPDGVMEYLGRIDHQVKIRGFRVELGEIESVLARHEAISAAVVTAPRDDAGRMRLMAYIVAADAGSGKSALDTAALRAHLADRLPDYMVPAAFVVLGELPLTSNGKVNRKALPAPKAAHSANYTAPRTPVEETIARIWADVIGVDRVGIHDNLFEIGGDSILSIQIVARAKLAGIALTLKLIFQYPTVAELASVCGTVTAHQAEQGEVTGPVPLTPIQRWFFAQDLLDPHYYNQSVLLETPADLTPGMLREAVSRLFMHHDMLRARFTQSSEGWLQEIIPAAGEVSGLFTVTDLTGHGDAEWPRALEDAANNVQAGLDLQHGPLFQAHFFTLGSGTAGRLLLVAHHLVIDGVSWRILLDDLQQACMQARDGVPVRLADKTTSFRNWSEHLRDYAASAQMRAEARYWAALPWDSAKPIARDAAASNGADSPQANTVAEARTLTESLSPELTRALLTEASEAYHTQINDILLAALAAALCRWNGADRVLVALEGHGREDIEVAAPESGAGCGDVSRTVGWFTSIFPVFLQAGPDTPPRDLLISTKEQLRSVPGRGIGYGLLRYLAVDGPEGDGNVALVGQSLRLWSNLEHIRRTDAARPSRAMGVAPGSSEQGGNGPLDGWIPYEPEISFNYLGQFDQAIPKDALFQPAKENAGSPHSPRNQRAYLLDINAMVAGGQLRISWTYGGRLHNEEAVRALALDYAREIERLVAHCLSPEAGAYTPSDFPDAKLTLEQLTEVITGLGDTEPEAIYPLSHMQQGMLFHTLLAPDSGEYVTQGSYELRGKVDVAAFEGSWRQVVDRHDILRTAFFWERLPNPVQVVCRNVTLAITQHDWMHLSTAERESALERFIAEDAATGFDCTRAPLMRLALIQLEPERYHVLWTHHHLLLDGWCQAVLFREVLACYAAHARGEEYRAERPRPYREYIQWLGRQDMDRAEAYWRTTLARFDSPTPLPNHEARPFEVDDPAYNANAWLAGADQYAEQLVLIPGGLSDECRRFAQQSQITLNTLMQGVWSLLLSRYSGHDDVLFGATVSGRPPSLPGIETMLGLFINTLPVRVTIEDQQPVTDWMHCLQAEAAARSEFEYSPLASVHGWSDVPRDTPLFSSLIVFENYPVDTTLGDLIDTAVGPSVARVDVRERTNYPLAVDVLPGAEIALRFGYQRSRFSDAAIEQLAGRWQTVLRQIAVEDRVATLHVGDLTLLTDTEQRQVVFEFNQTQGDLGPDARMHDLFTARALSAPDAVAVVFEEVQVTYGELNARANQLAHHLRTFGIGPETLVAVCLDRSPEMAVAVFGILKTGAAYVPIDPDYPAQRIAYILADSGARRLVATRRIAEALDLDPAPDFVLIDDESCWRNQPVSAVPGEADPDTAANMVYTSGSTGQPKGVIVSHRAHVNHIRWICRLFELTGDDAVLQRTSFGCDAFGTEFYMALISGARLVLPKFDGERDVDYLIDLIQYGRITISEMVPSLLRALMDRPEFRACTSLRGISCGGEALDAALIRRFHEVLGGGLYNTYGPTECAINTTFYFCDPEDDPPNVSIGRAITNAQAFVCDSHTRLVPLGVPGELCIAGVGLARGYHNRPDLTALAFVPNPYATIAGERLYRTGDQVRWSPDGNLEFFGRNDGQVKIRGFRIELGEIESALAQHSAISDAAVVVHPEPGGDNGQCAAGPAAGNRLTAFIVFSAEQRARVVPVTENGLRPDQGESAAAIAGSAPDSREAASVIADLRSHLKSRLPDYMTPSAFIVLDALPLNANGKVDRTGLTRRIMQGEFPLFGQDHRPDDAPRTLAEELIAGIWSDVLHIENVGRADSFFEMGGHSLLATQVISRVRAAFQAEIPLQVLFEWPRLAEFSERVQALRNEAGGLLAPPITPRPRDARPLPLSFAQQRLWFVDQLDPGTGAYNIASSLRLRGELDIPAFEASCSEVAARHEVLRSRIVLVQGQPRQEVMPPEPLPVATIDLSSLDAAEREPEAQRLAAREAARPFDLSRAPLVRVVLLRLAPDDHVLLFTMHHIASDAWSTSILETEFTTLYAAFRSGGVSPLAPLPLQYADYAVWQRQWLQGDVLERQLAYWREQLAGLEPLELITDRPRPAIPSYIGATTPVALAPGLIAALNDVGRRNGVTLFMTLTAGWQILMNRCSSQEDIVVGTDVAGRNAAETEGLVGFFVNQLVIRSRVRNTMTFAELLKQVRETMLAAYAYQDLPFDRLVEELAPERDRSRTPLFQVKLVLDNTPAQVNEIGSLSVSGFAERAQAAKLDLQLMLSHLPDGSVAGDLRYAVDLFDAATVQRMALDFVTILEALAADVQSPVSSVSLLGGDERRQVLTEWTYDEEVLMNMLDNMSEEELDMYLKDTESAKGFPA